jgi:phospholipid/cholesterol/gamma-HCH transport system substrate-binding protein
MKLGRDLIIGLTGILGLLGLAAMLVLFDELDLVEEPTYPVTLRLDKAAGVGPGSPVTLNGVVIGQVRTTRTAADPRDGVVMDLAIIEDQPLPRAVDVAVERDLVGSTRLAFNTMPRGEGPDGTVEPGGEIVASAGGLLEQIGGLLDERISPFGEAAESVKQLADTYTRVGERVELMLDPAGVDGEGGGEVNVFRTVAKLEAAVDEARGWLGDAELREGAADAVAQAERTLAEVEEAASAFRTAAVNIEDEARGTRADAQKAIDGFVEATASVQSALEEVQRLSATARTGRGSLALLLNDDNLYRSINDASVRLEKMLLEAQLLMEKYRTEGIDIDL